MVCVGGGNRGGGDERRQRQGLSHRMGWCDDWHLSNDKRVDVVIASIEGVVEDVATLVDAAATGLPCGAVASAGKQKVAAGGGQA